MIRKILKFLGAWAIIMSFVTACIIKPEIAIGALLGAALLLLSWAIWELVNGDH